MQTLRTATTSASEEFNFFNIFASQESGPAHLPHALEKAKWIDDTKVQKKSADCSVESPLKNLRKARANHKS